MKSKKKRIIVIILAVTGTGLIAWLAFSLIADYRYRALVAQTIDGIETSLKQDATFSNAAITRDDGCGRGVFKLGAGAESCRAAIVITESNLNHSSALETFTTTYEEVTKSTQLHRTGQSNINLEKISDGSSIVAGSYSLQLANYTEQCLLRADYTSSAERDGRAYLDSTTPGNLKIRLSCTNTDWWTRNIMNRFFY